MYRIVLYQRSFKGSYGWEFEVYHNARLVYDSYSEEYNGLKQPLTFSEALYGIEEYLAPLLGANELEAVEVK